MGNRTDDIDSFEILTLIKQIQRCLWNNSSSVHSNVQVNEDIYFVVLFFEYGRNTSRRFNIVNKAGEL